ncbi:MAG TPA: hypothetical protein VEX42_04805 [Microbacterium sp.]|nr:hypothetical protein [Microbacterium sp.]
MDTADSQHLSRLSKLLLAGIGAAFAWVLISFALGLAASQAHAAEDPGLLGAVTSTVDDTTSVVTDVVAHTAAAVVPTVEPVVQTVAPVVQTVAPVVQTIVPVVPVAPVIEVVEAAVAPVLTAVADVTESAAVAPIVDSTVAIVGSVPVVGDLATELGVDSAASSLGSSIDGVLQGAEGAFGGTVTDVVDSTGSTVTVRATPTVTGPEDVRAGTASLGAVTGAQSDAAAGPLEVLSRAAFLVGTTAWLTITSDHLAAPSSTDSAFVSGGAGTGVLSLIRSVIQADSVLIGPGGAGPGAWVLIALGFVVAYRAWVRRSGLENDIAPPAPVLSTDISPD